METQTIFEEKVKQGFTEEESYSEELRIRAGMNKKEWDMTSDWDRELIIILEEMEFDWRTALILCKNQWNLPKNYMPLSYPTLKEWIKLKEAN